jgi:hypothetical protein
MREKKSYISPASDLGLLKYTPFKVLDPKPTSDKNLWNLFKFLEDIIKISLPGCR